MISVSAEDGAKKEVGRLGENRGISEFALVHSVAGNLRRQKPDSDDCKGRLVGER